MQDQDQLRFLNPDDIKKISREEQLEIIKKLYALRMRSTYQDGYCKGDDYHSIKEPNEDVLISTAVKLFSERSQKVLAPPNTSRRVYGYCRPANYYTGLTEYQGKYSFFAYRKLLEQGAARLAPKNQFLQTPSRRLGKHAYIVSLDISPVKKEGVEE